MIALKPPKAVVKTRILAPESWFWSVGIDLGSVNDSTSIAVVEVQRGWEVDTVHRIDGAPVRETRRDADLHYLVRLVHRPRLGTDYPTIISQVKSLIEDLPPMPRQPFVVVDATGLGGPVVQQMRRQGIKLTGIAITAGNTATLTGENWSVPKALLVGELRMAMHRKRLKIAQGFAARETLQTELEAFTARLSASGRATFEAAGSEHDDTVLSLSMAVLAAKTRAANTAKTFAIAY